jgi:GNAT superfamily N-acetyltransferase
VRVAEIDVADDAQVEAFWSAAREGDAWERPYAAYWSLQAATVAFRAENNVVEQYPLAAIHDDEVVGTNQVMLPRLDNTHVAYMTPITRPAHRRRGVGTALLEAGVAYARARGRTTVIVEVNLPVTSAGPGESAGHALLRKHGFTEASLELHRVLDLPVEQERLDELAAGAAAAHDGYTLAPLRDIVPDELMDGYCAVQAAFNSEAPLGDLDLEPEVWNADRVRANEQRARLAGRLLRGCAALSTDGEVVALTEMMTSGHHPEFAWQSGTLVLREHRGHRLGLAVKVANLQAFQAEFAACRTVHSWNAEENGPMIAINDRLGFRPVEYLAEMQLKL